MKRIGGAKRRRQTGPSRRRTGDFNGPSKTSHALPKRRLATKRLDLARQGATAGDPAATHPPLATAPETARPVSLVVSESVRSGQTIVFREGDVTVIGSVSSGAEIIAGGSIHIYGTLRGRAFAGASGDPAARIFCRSLEAELLAINGLYRVADRLEQGLRGRPVQAWLEGKAIAMAPLE
jgi:septum site-determining protein MinC